MPVQIPQVERFQSQDTTPSVGRIETQVPNGEKDIASTNQIVDKGLSVTNDLMEKAENDAATYASISAANDYEIWKRGRAAEAKKTEGDPTHIYQQIDEDSTDKQNEILSQYKDYSPKAQAMIQMRLKRVDARLSNKMATDQAIAYNTWQNKTTDAQVGLASQSLMDSTMNLDAKDEKSFLPFDAQLDAIRDPIIALGKQRGLVTTDENGDEHYSPILDKQMTKATSAAIKSAVTTLNNSGRTDEAKYILDNYKDSILPADMATLTNDHRDSMIAKKAAGVLDSVRYLDEDAAIDHIKNAPGLDPQVRLKAVQDAGSYFSTLQKGKDAASKDAFETLVKNYNNNKDQYVDFNSFKNDPVNKTLMTRLKAKQLDAIKSTFDAPKVSDNDAKVKALDAMNNNKFNGMTPGDFTQMMHGLSKQDQSRFTTIYQNANDPSKSQQNTSLKYMGQQLQSELFKSGYVKNMRNASDKKKYQGAYDTLIDAWNSNADGLSKMPIGEQQKWVRDHATQLVTGQAFWNAGTTPKLQSSPAPTPEPAAPSPSPTPSEVLKKAAKTASAVNEQNYTDWALKFRKDNPKVDPKTITMKMIRDYAAKNGG